jgi:hypothetical protein
MPLAAAEPDREISVGASRSEVIEVHGQPTGKSKLGSVEILHYRNGQVRLENGKVQRINFRRTTPEPFPGPVENAVTPKDVPNRHATDPKAMLAEVWMTNLEEALEDANRRNSPILALFTRSDASPTERQFQHEITFHPEFVNAFRARYVLLHVDFPERATQTAELRAQNEALRELHGITKLPALLILSATGEKLAGVDIADSVPGGAFRARFIAAVWAAYQLPAITAITAITPSEPAPAPPTPAPPAEVPAAIHVAPEQVKSGLTTARWLVSAALIVGTLIAAALLIMLWAVVRRLNKPVVLSRRSSIAWRIDHAASGLPSFAEIGAWPQQTLCKIVIRLAETEGFVAQPQPFGSGKDLVLKRSGDMAPEFIVCCVTGSAGLIPMRRVRELVGMMVAENVPGGWFIAPTGFSVEARAYAEQNNIRLIDGAALLEQLSNLPTFVLPKVLAAAR